MGETIKIKCPKCEVEIEKPESEDKLWCVNCEEAKDEGVKLYECGDCGTIFSSENSADGCGHSCPDCNKWGHTLVENGCPDCEGEDELEERKVYECPECGEEFCDEEIEEVNEKATPKSAYKKWQRFVSRSTLGGNAVVLKDPSKATVLEVLADGKYEVGFDYMEPKYNQKPEYRCGRNQNWGYTWGIFDRKTMTEAELNTEYKPVTPEESAFWEGQMAKLFCQKSPEELQAWRDELDERQRKKNEKVIVG
jgi:hypothetical protein